MGLKLLSSDPSEINPMREIRAPKQLTPDKHEETGTLEKAKHN